MNIFSTLAGTSRRRSLAAGVAGVYVVTILLVACGGGSGPATSDSTPMPQSARSGKAAMFAAPKPSGERIANTVTITDSESSTAGSRTLTLKLPTVADVGTLDVVLNGKTVTPKFAAVACDAGTCLSGTVAATDGLSTIKNVVSASVHGSDGTVATGRLRFAARSEPIKRVDSKATAQSARALGVGSSVNSCDPVADCPPYLPPTVRLETLNPGGYYVANGPWIKIGTQSYPSTTPSNCSGSSVYIAIVLDRQTLQEKTAAPESSPQCFSSSADINAYFKTLTANDLVITGTVFGSDAQGGLDATPIGASPPPAFIPIAGWMAIGAGQQTGGAYQAYYDRLAGDPSYNVFATGILQEDANGNYNFQSSDVVEYAVSPNDPAYFTGAQQSAFAIKVPASQSGNFGTADTLVYTPPSGNGLWLLVLDRVTLQPASNVPCQSAGASGKNAFFTSCGRVFTVGDSATRDQEYGQLALALAAVNRFELAVLVSTNTAAADSSSPNFPVFATALQRLGGTPLLTVGGSTAYSFIGFQGAGNAIAGAAVESSSLQGAQGQFGFVHGILQRNNSGLFQPSQASQAPQVVFASSGGLNSPDFKLAIAAYQQPVDWPSNSQTTLLPGAASIAGQTAAYRFISHWLLANFYVKGIRGPHQDDIHYFFNGSSNTFIDYHTFDPVNLSFPIGTGGWSQFQCASVSGDVCTMQAPGDGAASTFTSADFAAVKSQLSLEVQYLTNTLQFLVTGSTNMKDVVAAGNANVGLALTGAAATILGSKLVPVPSTTSVSISWQSILGLLGGVASAVADAEGLGELSSAWAKLSGPTQTGIKAAVGASNTLGALAGVAGAAGQIRTETTTNHSIPSPFTTFTRTIGELATTGLQSQLSAGFDVTADSLTSDWARLSSIGPMVVDTANPVYYSPNLVSQSNAVQALVKASSQSFYFALLPSFYQVHFWPKVQFQSATQPDMGYEHDGATANICTAFYLNPQSQYSGILGSLTVNQAVYLPSMGPPSTPFTQDVGSGDWYVIGGPSNNPGSTNTVIPTISADLGAVLFARDQLNISMTQFVSVNGPMGGVWIDASKNSPAGHTNGSICPAADPSFAPDSATRRAPPSGTPTTTTLQSTSSTLAGGSSVLTAVVMAGNQAVTIGKVYFVDNGVVIGSSGLDANGTATFTLRDASLGAHSIEAQYSRDGQYQPSTSAVSTVGVYNSLPDLAILPGLSRVDVSYDAASAPVPLEISSLFGLTGEVKLSCSGLPAGMSCTFAQPTSSLTADGKTSATLVIGPSLVTQAAGVSSLLFLVFFGSLVIRPGWAKRKAAPLLLAASVATAGLAGCGGGSSDPSPRETGTKTVLVTATVGSVSRSVPLEVTIK